MPENLVHGYCVDVGVSPCVLSYAIEFAAVPHVRRGDRRRAAEAALDLLPFTGHYQSMRAQA